MTKWWIVANLNEAIEQLQDIVTRLEEGDTDEDGLRYDLGHAYYHINAAYNGRHLVGLDEKEFWDQKDPFRTLRPFPRDLPKTYGGWFSRAKPVLPPIRGGEGGSEPKGLE